jgi:cytochrome b involved in lipid metabolism
MFFLYQVYDVGSYLDEHPGGDDVILATTGIYLHFHRMKLKLHCEKYQEVCNDVALLILIISLTLCNVIEGKDATDEFEDAGHSKSARELLETFFIGELDLSATVIPELEISSKKQADYTQKLKDLTKQYWAVSVAIAGVSVVGFLYLRKK